MSKTRRITKNIPTKTDMDRKLHRAQQRAGLFKPAPPFKFTATEFRPNWFFWFIVVNVGIAAARNMAPANGAKHDNSIRDKVRNKIAVDNLVRNEPGIMQACDTLPDKFAEVAAAQVSARESMERVLEQPNFRIVCTSDKALQTSHPGACGMFIGEQNMLVVPHDTVTSVTIHHEMIHADYHALHSEQNNCHLPPDKIAATTAPVFPVNQQNIKIMQDALSKGEARVRRFNHLYRLERAGKKLNDADRQELRTYKQIAKNCIPNSNFSILPLTELGVIKRKAAAGKPFAHTVMGVEVMIYKVDELKDGVKVQFTFKDCNVSVLSTLEQYDYHVNNGEFKHDIVLELSERMAWSRQSLADAWPRLFPEAAALHNQFVQQCRGNNRLNRAEL